MRGRVLGRWGAQAWALGERACWRWARRAGAQAAGMAAGAGGALGAQQAQAWAGVGAGGLAECWAQARVAGVRNGANVRGRARQGATGRAGARGRQAGWARQARGARPAWAWPGRSLCARAGPAGSGWGFVHSDSVFLARFDSVVSRVTK